MMANESTIESESPDRPTEHLEVEARLIDALGEWDGEEARKQREAPPPEVEPRDPEEIAEYKRRIASLEGNVSEATTRAERLESELSEATQRGELVDNALAFYDEAAMRLDQADADRLLDHLVKEIGCDRHVADLELKMKLLQDPDFAAAADARFEDADTFQAMLSQFEDTLVERYPRHDDDHGLTAAVRAARSVPASDGHGEFSGVDWSRLTDQQFRAKSREVFDAMKRGTLQPTRRWGGGWFTTLPD